MRFQFYWILFLFTLLSKQLHAANSGFELYLFVYSSAQTTSGAGHISFAFGPDSSQLTYYTKYRKADGGCFKLKDISYQKAFAYDHLELKHQSQEPSLVLKLKAQEPELAKLEQLSDYWNLEKPWTLFVNNCTDALKRTLRTSQINPGLAFLISTPNELIEDLYAHHLINFKNQDFKVVYGDLQAYLKSEPNAVPQTLFGKPAAQKNKPKQKEAILILTGFGSKYHSLQNLNKYFDTTAYDVYVPNYISRKSLEQTVFNLDSYWKKKGLDNYEKVHIFAYIIGSWSINAWLQTAAHPNIKSIVYDRSALQERAPYILISNYKIPNYFVFGPIMHELHQTPYLPSNDSSIQKGLLLECYATGIVRKNQATAAQLGPYCFEPDCFAQQYQDAKYVPLNHDQMYTHPEVYGAALLHFFKYGNFGSTLNAYSPVADPFIKHQP
jgi:hypothetical protein